MLHRIAAFAVFIFACSFFNFEANSATLTWRIKSNYPYTVDLSFYSSMRNHEWPGGGQVWILNDSRVHTFRLSCIHGEKICYGAWVRGNTDRYWGVGYGGHQGCSSCCYVCGRGRTQTMVLNP